MQAMITLGVMSTMILSFMKMTENQRQAAAQLQQKLAALDLQRSLSQVLQDGSVCEYALTNPAPPAFNPVLFNAQPGRLLTTLPSLNSYAGPNAKVAVRADGHSPVSQLDDKLAVSSITVGDVTCDPAPCTPSSSFFNANITVNFAADRLIMALAPLKFPISFDTSGPPGRQVVTDCANRTTLKTVTVWSDQQTCGGGAQYPNCTTTPKTVTAPCPPGYMVTGCGFNLSQWAPSPTGLSPDVPHSNAPDTVELNGNGCATWAGGAPACGVCFRAQSMCIQIK